MVADCEKVRKIYHEIYNAFQVMRLENARSFEAKQLSNIMDSCQKLFDIYQMQLKSPSVEDLWYDTLSEEACDISDAIKQAYHLPLFAETIHEEDRYFLETEHVQLLDWDEKNSPYRELQCLSFNYYNRRDVRLSDLAFFFQEIKNVINENLPLPLFIARVNSLFQNMGTKCLK